MKSSLKRVVCMALLLVATTMTTAGCGASWGERKRLRNLYAEDPLYTCCNLRPSDRSISDANWYETSSPLATPNGALPFGTPVELVGVGRKSFRIRTEDLGEFTISLEYGNETLAEYMDKLVVRENPADVVGTFPNEVQEAIWEARVIPGMTKEQVLIAIGYPPTHRTPGTTSYEWTYWSNRWRTYKLQFNRDGRLSRGWGRLPGPFGQIDWRNKQPAGKNERPHRASEGR